MRIDEMVRWAPAVVAAAFVTVFVITRTRKSVLDRRSLRSRPRSSATVRHTWWRIGVDGIDRTDRVETSWRADLLE